MIRPQLPLLLLLAYSAPVLYFAGEDLQRELAQADAPLVIKKIAVPAEPAVPHAHAVAQQAPAGSASLGARALGYLDEVGRARAFLDAYRTSAVALPDCASDHPYNLALKQRRDDLPALAALAQHCLGAGVANLRKSRTGSFSNRELDACLDALVKLEEVHAQQPPLAAEVSRWMAAWDVHRTVPVGCPKELKRRAQDYRDFMRDTSRAAPCVRMAAEEVKKIDAISEALAQLDAADQTAVLKNLKALRQVLGILDPDRHPQAFTRARHAVLHWCRHEAPADLPLDKVWIGSPRKTACERKEVKIEWDDGTITPLDQPHRGIVYDEEALGRLDGAVKSKITIHTPLGSGSPDDLTATEKTKNALAFNQAARQLRERLAEMSSYRSIAAAFRGARQIELADELDRYQLWDR